MFHRLINKGLLSFITKSETNNMRYNTKYRIDIDKEYVDLSVYLLDQ